MYASYFQESLKNFTETIPFQAHSHHLWPDSSKQGMEAYWQDASTLIDDKWSKIFDSIIPTVQKQIANMINVEKHTQISFAPNTHELIFRLLSSFSNKNLKILTTSSEFYSLARQLRRMEEEKNIEITLEDLSSFNGDPSDFSKRIIRKSQETSPDILIFSQCFFDTGFFIPDNFLQKIAEEVPPQTLIVIDGYHSFATRPIDLSSIEKRVFFTAGGYKYAMSGEGVCFLYAPPSTKLRPLYTGWMSSIENLSNSNEDVLYPDNWLRFAGSTFDPSGLYRFFHVWENFKDNGVTLSQMHHYVQDLQRYFLEKLTQKKSLLSSASLKLFDKNNHAHFFSFEFLDEESANEVFQKIREQKIIIDKRKNYIRFGFGIYLTTEMIDQTFKRISL